MLRLRRRLAVAGLCLFLFVGLAEGVLRLVYRDGVAGPLDSRAPWDWLEADPILGWRNRANYRSGDFEIDERHLRRVPAPRSGATSRRVLCLGDSRTFGVWLDLGRFRYDNDYPRYLAELFASAEPHQQVEVLNAGVLGYTSAKGLRWVRTGLLADLSPDVVVAAFGVNDHSRSWNSALRTPDPDSAVGRTLLARSARWRLVQVSLAALRRFSSLHAARSSTPWVERDDYATNLHRLADAIRRHRAALLFLDIGLRPLELGASLPAFPGPTDRGYELLGASTLEEVHRLNRSYAEVLRRVAASEGVPLIDGARVLAASEAAGVSSFGPYDLVHPNVEGAKLLAEAVYRTLRTDALASQAQIGSRRITTADPSLAGYPSWPRSHAGAAPGERPRGRKEP